MRALCLSQPWAQLVLDGVKPLETRVWNTHHRGDLLIIASGSWWELPPSSIDILKKIGYPLERLKQAPRKVTLCVVNVLNSRPMVKEDEEKACIELYPKAWAWELTDIRPVVQKPIKGQRRLFEVDDAYIEYMEVQQ